MDGTKFRNIVNYYGEANILGILFDNSAVKMFSKGEFSLANNYIDDIEALQFIDFTLRMQPYHTVKDVENIQGFIIRDSGVAFEEYDRIGLRG